MQKAKNKILLFFLSGVLFLQPPAYVLAADATSTNFIVQDPVITSGLYSATSSSFGLGQSLSQIAIGKSTSTSFQLLSGFQYYFKANSNVLTAIAGNGQVDLSWTVPQIFLGGVISNYELGVGTTSGVYTYSNVGNVTSYTQTGLTNGTTYYFKVKAKTAGGMVLTYSNEASATPSGASPTGGGGGGGGGGGYGYAIGTVKFSGFTSPFSQVVILRNSQAEGKINSGALGEFSTELVGQPAGAQIYSLYAVDPDGTKSAFLNTQIVVKENSTAQSNNLLLPPTILLNKTEVKQGSNILFFGYTLPNASVGLEALGKTSDQFTVNSSAAGYYKFDVNTKNAALGAYFARSKAILGNNATDFSSRLNFLVGSRDVEIPEIGQCPKQADFNNDCRVDLIDFSILAYWYQKSNPDPKIDLNSDGIVDLVDFSILAYYWTG